MKRLFSSLTIVLPLLALLLSSAHARETIPSEYFSRLPKFDSVKLSPEGDKLASIVNIEERSYAAVQDLKSGEMHGLTKAANKKYKVANLRWLNNDYLGIGVTYNDDIRGGKIFRTALLSQYYTGTSDAKLVTHPREDERNPSSQTDIVDLMPDDPKHILMALRYDDWRGKSVFKVEIGGERKRKRIQHFRAGATRWITDKQNNIRAYATVSDDNRRIYARLANKKRMKLLWQFKALSEEVITPLGFDKDPDMLFVNAYDDKGYLSVFKVDIGNPQLTLEPVYSVEGRDVPSSLLSINATDEVIGVSSPFEIGRYYFFNKAYKDIVEKVDKSLADTQERLLGLSDDGNRMLFYSWGSDFPGAYSIFDLEANKLNIVAYRYPELNKYQLAKKLPVSYQARDGESINAYLTLPVGYQDTVGPSESGVREPIATIIFPHGGPISKDGDDFDYWTQFFASRGYAVLQMNFRGSSGYGYDFMSAGFANWGRAMQDDVTDGVKWLIDKGIADKSRICIAGGSYGGYSALIGLAKTPDLYRCGISYAGVTDIPALIPYRRGYVTSEVAKKMLGEKRSVLKKNSPVYLAENITSPVLIMHGKRDVVVSFEQAEKMKKALKKSSAEVEYLILEEGDHRLSRQSDRHEVFRAMDKFLARHLPVD